MATNGAPGPPATPGLRPPEPLRIARTQEAAPAPAPAPARARRAVPAARRPETFVVGAEVELYHTQRRVWQPGVIRRREPVEEGVTWRRARRVTLSHDLV